MSLLQPDPRRIDPEWMTMALRAADAICDATVVEVICAPIGNGLVGDSYRFNLTYDERTPEAPASVIGKFPAADPASRQSGVAHSLYLREVSFYRDLAQTLAVFTPRPFVTEIAPETSDFTLILEDLAPARQGDQLAGCSVEDAKVAMGEDAAMHASRWGDPMLERLDWLVGPAATAAVTLTETLPLVVELFKERYVGVLEPEFVALIDRLPAALARNRTDRSAPLTLQHADFRLDNVLFEVKGGAYPMATLDWQTPSLGPGVMDAAYFLSAAFDPDVRRAHEGELIRFYHAELVRRGVRGYDWDQCWFDYRRQTLHGVLMGVFSALSVERTERGDALFLKMTRGACAQALDHKSFDFWEE